MAYKRKHVKERFRPKPGRLLGHADLRTTMIYTHVMNINFETLGSPLDNLNSP